ncbi:MAG: lamin tail domain-containing protein [Chitinispirillia bacterium]|jgi:hypothetical protein
MVVFDLSAINKTVFFLIAVLLIHVSGELKVTEIHYNPIGEGLVGGAEFEFIELKNTGTSGIDLTNAAFSKGIDYTFPPGTIIESGKFLVIASNSAEFKNRYGFEPFAVYNKNLSNGGEEIILVVTTTSDTLLTIKYNDKNPWPQGPDGNGFSLVSKEINPTGDPNDPSYWKSSVKIHGSPGCDDSGTEILGVFVNEALTHTDFPDLDAVELFNPHNQSIDIGGWYLTDNKDKPKKFKIPAGVVIKAGSYKVFNENEMGFSLNSHGDEVYIFSANSGDSLTGYCHGFDFGEIENRFSFGRHVTSEGKEHFVIQKEITLGKENAGPKVGPLIISEIMYNHPDLHEYIEITNIGNEAIKLYDPSNPQNTWKIGGVAFNFPENFSIPVGGTILLINNNITINEFKSIYKVPDGVKIFSDTGSLSNNGETVTIYKPENPYFDTSETSIDTIIPYIIIDRVKYNDKSPWPVEPDGNGTALERKSLGSHGNDPANWRSINGTPGIVPIYNSFKDKKKYKPHFYISAESSKNPFISIHFNLEMNGIVSLDLYNFIGRHIKKVYGGNKTAGIYNLKLNKNIFPSGLYLLRLNTNGTFFVSKTFMLIK